VYTSVLSPKENVAGSKLMLKYYMIGIMSTVLATICIFRVNSMLSFLTGKCSANNETRKEIIIPVAVIVKG